MLKTYDINVSLNDVEKQVDVFNKTYKIALREEFVKDKNFKDHSLANHIEGFLTLMKQNSNNPTKHLKCSKRQIYVVSYGMNAGSEINGDRPSIIYKASHSTLGEDVIVIPLTSALKEKQSDKYDIFVSKDTTNNLFQNSYARLRQLRSVSVKRIGKCVGLITQDDLIASIDATMEKMLGMEKTGIETAGIAE